MYSYHQSILSHFGRYSRIVSEATEKRSVKFTLRFAQSELAGGALEYPSEKAERKIYAAVCPVCVCRVRRVVRYLFLDSFFISEFVSNET